MANRDSDYSGSEVMYPAVPSRGEGQLQMVPSSPYVIPGQAGVGAMPSRGPDILHGPLDQTWLMNCLRRRWLAALLLGALTAVLAGLLLLWLFPLSSEVVAYLQIENEEGQDIFNERPRVINSKEAEAFQQTQVALLKSQFVLTSALTRSDISQLNAVVKERPNELQWLMDELQVLIPDKSQVLMIKYEGDDDPEEMKRIINAVIDSYEKEVLYKAKALREGVHNTLSTLFKDVKGELREKTDKMQALQEEFHGAGSPNASAELNLLAREIALLQQSKIDLKETLAELEVNRVLQTRVATSESVVEDQIAEALDKDPTLQGIREKEFYLQDALRSLEAASKRPNPQTKNLRAQLNQLRQEADMYRRQMEQEMKAQWKSKPNEALQMIMTEYIMRKGQIQQQLEDVDNELKEKYDQIEALGQQNSDLAILVNDVEQLNDVARQMDLKLRAWKVDEEAAAQQVKVIQPAFATEQINIYERLTIAGVGALAAFCMTCYGVALVEFRRRRLNSPEDVDEGLGIRVLGVLPPVASRRSLAPGSITAAQLAESIDSVRATLIHDSTSRPRQVIMVASPSSMEGSTTVASHLALSLSRAGRRTLLVDGDLRAPSLHKLFGMPLEDGLSELLRSEMEVSDAIRPTNTEGLWLLTAGQCDPDAVHALATDQLQPIFDKLRSEFDFIIIDGAPFLGLSDSLSIGQHVDGAILTVLRDHSGVRSIYQTSELLKSLGIRLIGCVVNGMPFKADRRITRIRSAGPGKTKQLPAAKDEQ